MLLISLIYSKVFFFYYFIFFFRGSQRRTRGALNLTSTGPEITASVTEPQT